MGGVWNFLIILRLEVAVAVVVAVGEVEVVGTRTVTSVVNLAILRESANCGLAQGDWEVEGVEALAHLAIDEVLAMVVVLAGIDAEAILLAVTRATAVHQHIVVKTPPPMPMGV
ncbi:hypothetical protein B296_00045708 [Ensete ventricosum]|uniref:Secreted protein n=1 Tax=Ensete ventricosum TaxID=4639 RepID=A0A426YRX9_ENSVE|nr:hypothetical protein B296_00045708 [Ensete ventricosum]